jgi:Flp pilus assembly protein TadG
MVEFALTALLFLTIIFASFNFFYWTFAKAALHSAVREGVRYAITGQSSSPHGQDDSIRQVVMSNAFGLLNSAPAGTITVQYFAAADGSSTPNNAAGSIVMVSVLNYTPPVLSSFLGPLVGLPTPRISVTAVDKVEPFTGGSPPRTLP